MGVFGPGNFQSDAAADHLHGLMSKLVEEIELFVSNPPSLEPDERGGTVVPCNVELLSLIAQNPWMGCRLPDRATAERWRKVYMGVWKKTIGDLAPDKDYKRARREALTRTFDNLIEQIERRSK